MVSSRVWLVTGAGRGIGRAIVIAALATGDRVVATVRREDALRDLQDSHPHTLRVLGLDVRDRAAVMTTVGAAVDAFGRLDVVVNNAGYGLVGAVEETGEAEIRSLLDTDLYGAIWVTQAVLPWLRDQGSGHIVQISTVGGVGTVPLLGFYNAAKWALEGFSEALAAEIAPFGIRVTIAELGGFGTDWGRSSMRFATPSDAYDDLRQAVFGSATVPWEDDPDAPAEPPASEAAAAILDDVGRSDGPLRLLVGADAPALVAAALDLRRVDYGRDPRFRWPTGADQE